MTEDLTKPVETAPDQLLLSGLGLLKRGFAACDGNVRQSARRAGVNAVTMCRLLRKRGLRLSREVLSDD